VARASADHLDSSGPRLSRFAPHINCLNVNHQLKRLDHQRDFQVRSPSPERWRSP
jgi:hypothetical protein